MNFGNGIQFAGATVERRLRNIDRTIAREGLARLQSLENVPRLLTRAAAQLRDDGRDLDATHDFARMSAQNPGVGAREPIFGEYGDGLKQGGAQIVV